MKAKPLKIVGSAYPAAFVLCKKTEATHIELRISDDYPVQVVPVARTRTNGCWTWNGSIEAPTIRPNLAIANQSRRQIARITGGWIEFVDKEFRSQPVQLLEVE